jgi:hypothetical protein
MVPPTTQYGIELTFPFNTHTTQRESGKCGGWPKEAGEGRGKREGLLLFADTPCRRCLKFETGL